MSIASEIERLQGVKADILQSIADKGVEVPSGSMLADCPNLIASISSGGGILDFSKYHYDFLTNGTQLWHNDNFILSSSSAVDFKPCWGTDIYLNGKNVTFCLRANMQDFITSVGAIIGVTSEHTHNYESISVHYNSSTQQIWLGLPNSDNSAWQTMGWVDCNIPTNIWFNLRYILDQTSKNIKLYIDDVLYIDYDYADEINFASSSVSFGCNWNYNYRMYEMVDSSQTYIIDNDTNEIIWGLYIP